MPEARVDWSREEVEAIVADYFAMLTAEIKSESVNKTEHRRRLALLLRNRSDGSIERKHQNISAILLEQGFPYVDGYKPLRNYQQLLHEVVTDRLATDRALRASVMQDVARPVQVPTVDEILSALVNAPVADRPRRVRERPSRQPVLRSVNYLELEARNAELGRQGEEFVLAFERARLLSQGQDRLAAGVEHVAVTRGDGLGFDILSFDSNGRERFVEVKTTRYGQYTPFFATRREVEFSEQASDSFHLCRVFDFRARPRLFTVVGSLRLGFDLDPTQYQARIA